MNSSRPNLDDVLQAMQSSVDVPDCRTAKVWCARYPEFTDDITTFVGEWLYQLRSTSGPGSVNEGLAHTRAGSDLANRLHKFRSRVMPPGIISTAQASGIDIFEVAGKLDCSVELLEMLDSKTVQLSSIPDRFIAALSEHIKASIDWLVGWLARGGLSSPSPSFIRSVLPPSGEERSKRFEEAWAECGLAREDLESWMK